MMKSQVNKVVILGGGTAGWMSAAMIQKLLGKQVDVELVESEDIGTIGVGEATIPPIRLFNSVLGIDHNEFLRETNATIKLGIKFENWKCLEHSYFHTFGSAGNNSAFCQFHHFLNRAQKLGHDKDLWQYDLNYLCAESGKFGQFQSQDPSLELPYAYHFDAGLYALFLRKFSEKIGVTRTEGIVERVEQDVESGNIKALYLKDTTKISGDLFIDCSGMRALLIQGKLKTGFEDWSHWLQCDSAIAVPSKRMEKTLPYTRSIAHQSGWQWRIPLQHRNGNGLVYSSAHLSDKDAQDLLMSSLDSPAIDEPKLFKFTTGRRLKQWNKNVVAIGLSSGFLEPLESTSIHLIQSAIIRLVHLFPHAGIDEELITEYNKQSKTEYEQIRDFIILHYYVNQRTDSQFWHDMRNMPVPASLKHKLALFSGAGRLFREQNDLFLESSWLQVMVGQGIEQKDYHPMANSLSEVQLKQLLQRIYDTKSSAMAKLQDHDIFLKQACNMKD